MLAISATVRDAVERIGAMPSDINRAKKRAARGLRRRIEKEAVRHVAKKLGTTQKAWRASNPGTRGKRVFVSMSKSGGLRLWVGTNPMLLHYLGRLKWNRSMPGVLLRRGAGRGTQMFEDAFLIDSPYRRRKLAFERLIGRQRKKPRLLPSGRLRKNDEKIVPVTSEEYTLDREAEEALRDFSLDIDDLWQREVHKALKAELAREGLYAQNLDSVTL